MQICKAYCAIGMLPAVFAGGVVAETAADQRGGKLVVQGIVNAAPVVSNLDGDVVILAPGETSILIDAAADAVVNDPDSANFAGGNVTAAVTANFEAGDELIVTNFGPVNIVAGFNVRHGIVTIGVQEYDSNTGVLTVALDADANAAIIGDVLSAIRYTKAPAAFSHSRTVTVKVDDGDGGIPGNQIVTILTECSFGSSFESGEIPCG